MARSNQYLINELKGGFEEKNILFCGNTSLDILNKVSKFEFRKDDVVLLSYPKTGSHLLAEIVGWLLVPDKCNQVTSHERTPFLEMLTPPTHVPNIDGIRNILPTIKRIYRSHLRPEFLPSPAEERKPKMVYIWRNPLDTAVSFFHFYQKMPPLGPFKGSWNEFFQRFIEDKVVFGGYFDHLKNWLNARDKYDILFIQYESILKDLEDLKADSYLQNVKIEDPVTASDAPKSPDVVTKEEPVVATKEIQRIADFLGKKLDNKVLKNIAINCSFAKMAKNPLIFSLICRKGEVGDWKNYFSDEQKEMVIKRFNETVNPLGLEMKLE